MANNIRGITVEIGGNTEPLNNALKDVNKTSRNLQSELREVDKALKLDPANTTLLAQKQALLAESITNTRGKLETLKQAEAQAQEQFRQGNIGAEQYRALQREVINTEQQLRNLEQQTSHSSTTMNEHANSSDKASKGLKGVGVGVIAAGAALGGAAVAGVKMSDDLQKALNGIESATGYSKESMSSMKDVMVGIYNNNFGENFEDIGKAIEEVGKQTNATGKELQGMTENALLLRDTFGFEVTESTRSAKMMMDQFGLSGKESYNLIAQGAQWGLDKNGDLLDTINEYSVHFKQAGFSAEEMFNMLQNGTAGGTFSVDKLGDAVKEFGIRTKDGSKGTMEAFQALGLDADKLSSDFAKGGATGKQAFEEVNKKLLEMKDPLAQNQVATALYGTMWEDLGVKGITALTDTKGEISNTTDALGKINAVKYNTFGEAVEGIKRQLQTGILLPLGEEILPILNKFGTYLQQNMPSIIGTAKQALGGLEVAFKALKTTIGFVIDNFNIIGPIMVGVVAGFAAFKIIGVVTALMKAWKESALLATYAQGGLNAVMAANPMGVVVIAIGALVAAGIALCMNWDKISKFFEAIWQSMKATADTVFNGIKNTIDTVTNSISNTFTSTWNSIKNTTETVFNGIKSTITTIFNSILDFFREWGPLMLAILTGPIGLLVLLFVKNWDDIKSKTETIFNGVKSAIETPINLAKNGVKIVLKEIANVFTNTWTTLKSTTEIMWNGIKDAITTPINAARDIVKDAIDSISGFFRNIKIPHINVHTEWGGPGNAIPYPSFDVKWYDKGGIFNTPHIIGVGEKRPEFVGALDDLRKIVREESGKGNRITQNFNFHVPTASPSEVARQSKRAQQELALEF